MSCRLLRKTTQIYQIFFKTLRMKCQNLHSEITDLSWFIRCFSKAMPQLAKLFLEPVSNRLSVYGQNQFAVICRILFYLENIVLDVKLPPVFFGINPAVASDSLFLRQKTLYHFFGKPDNSA